MFEYDYQSHYGLANLDYGQLKLLKEYCESRKIPCADIQEEMKRRRQFRHFWEKNFNGTQCHNCCTWRHHRPSIICYGYMGRGDAQPGFKQP